MTSKYEELNSFLYKMYELKNENTLIVNKFCDVCGRDGFNSPIVESGWKFMDLTVEIASKYFGDNDVWLSWFIYDNDFGKNKLCVYPNEEVEVMINSIESFIGYFKEYIDE